MTKNMIKFFLVFLTAFLSCFVVQAQNTSIHEVDGKVIDFMTGKALSQISISIKDIKSLPVESSDVGTFTLKVPSGYVTLVLSYPGYQTKEFPLTGRSKMTISLVPDGVSAGESKVEVPYYGSINENNLNGAAAITVRDNEKSLQYPDLFAMLAGTTPGLQSNSFSGMPGEGQLLNLRGVRSLYCGNSPLIVVDGLPLTNTLFEGSVVKGNIYNALSDINVKDIASIVVLKDAAAAGIYGARGSNGVIQVTTKNGTTGKTYLDITSQTSFTNRFDELPVMNATQYNGYIYDKLIDRGLTRNAINSQFPMFGNTDKTTSEYWRYTNNTDWQKEVTRNIVSQNMHLSLRGGDGTSAYLFSVGYEKQPGVMEGVDLQRFNTRFNLRFRLLKKLSIGTNLAFARTNKNLMDQGYDERINPLYLSLVKPPVLGIYGKNNQGVNSAVYDQNPISNYKQYPFVTNQIESLSNPVAVVNNVQNSIISHWLCGNVFAQYDFNKSLFTKLNIGIDKQDIADDRFIAADGIVPTNNDPTQDRYAEKQIFSQLSLFMEHTLNFEKIVSFEHYLNAFAGYTIQMNQIDRDYGFAAHASTDYFTTLGSGTIQTISDAVQKWNTMAFFGNVDYRFRDKFLIKAGVRLEGSSRFGNEAAGDLKLSSQPFAVLPYAGITWRMGAEPWMNFASNVFDELNIRASMGKSANQNVDNDIKYASYVPNYYTLFPGLIPGNIANKGITWETTYNHNVGLDVAVFNRTLAISGDYFETKTVNLLNKRPVDSSTGSSFVWTNDGEIRNKGVEVGLSLLGRSGRFNWRIGANVGKYLNTVVKTSIDVPVVESIYGYYSLATQGQAAGKFFGYQSLGVFSTNAEATSANLTSDRGVLYKAGDFHYQDVNRDGIINTLDMQDIGDPNPDYFGNFTLSMGYKNFALESVFTFSQGNQIMNVLRSKLEVGNGYENQSVVALNRWKSEGDVTNIPNTLYGDPQGNIRPSSNWVEDGSYLKFKSLTLSYSINQKLAFVRSARIFVSGYNLFTWTKYLGWDPDVRSGSGVFTNGYDFGNVQSSRTVMLGVSLSL
jgi:TonB-linked SusC/RagA family outer membrane protein